MDKKPTRTVEGLPIVTEEVLRAATADATKRYLAGEEAITPYQREIQERLRDDNPVLFEFLRGFSERTQPDTRARNAMRKGIIMTYDLLRRQAEVNTLSDTYR